MCGPMPVWVSACDISITSRIPNLSKGVTRISWGSTRRERPRILVVAANHAVQEWCLAPAQFGYGQPVTYGGQSDEPIGEEVPLADAVEQRLPVGETSELSEDLQPTELDRIATQERAPQDVDPADWQDQRTSADIAAEEWDGEL